MFSGSTACVCLTVTCSNKSHKLYLANIGDSRAVAFSKSNEESQLTVDHTPKNIEEQSRVYKAGGEIIKNKISSYLEFTRSFVDFEYKANPLLPIKNQVVIVMPDIFTIDLTTDINYIILGSSGLYKHSSNKELCTFISNILDKYQIKNEANITDLNHNKILISKEEYGQKMCNALIQLFDKLILNESLVV
jgi:serine/threonine protein phosphatase PrpC